MAQLELFYFLAEERRYRDLERQADLTAARLAEILVTIGTRRR